MSDCYLGYPQDSQRCDKLRYDGIFFPSQDGLNLVDFKSKAAAIEDGSEEEERGRTKRHVSADSAWKEPNFPCLKKKASFSASSYRGY